MTTKLKVTSINTGKAVNDAEATEVPQVAPLSLDMIQEESPLPHDGDHLNKGIMWYTLNNARLHWHVTFYH